MANYEEIAGAAFGKTGTVVLAVVKCPGARRPVVLLPILIPIEIIVTWVS